MFTKHFYEDHYLEVLAARIEKGLPIPAELKKVELKDHYLIGLSLLSNDNKTWEIKSVHYLKDDSGWYLVLLIEFEGSHTQVFWKNINSQNNETLKAIEISNNEFSLIDDSFLFHLFLDDDMIL